MGSGVLRLAQATGKAYGTKSAELPKDMTVKAPAKPTKTTKK